MAEVDAELTKCRRDRDAARWAWREWASIAGTKTAELELARARIAELERMIAEHAWDGFEDA